MPTPTNTTLRYETYTGYITPSRKQWVLGIYLRNSSPKPLAIHSFPLKPTKSMIRKLKRAAFKAHRADLRWEAICATL